MIDTLITTLLGLDADAQILDWRITYAYPLPEWLILFVMVLLVAFSYWNYRSEDNTLTRKRRAVLTTLRSMTWIFVFLLVLQPRLQIDHLHVPPSNLAILIDSSESMSLVDKQAGNEYISSVQKFAGGSIDAKTDPRSKIVEHMLSDENLDLLNRLSEKYRIEVFQFDENANNLNIKNEDGELNLPEADGLVTQYGQALREVRKRLRGMPLAGVVTFSDGANNKGEDPQVVADHFGQNGVPIFPVGIGAPQAVDIEIVDVAIPELLFKDDSIAITVTFKASSLDGVDVPVELSLGDKEVGRGQIVAEDGRFQQEFVITPTEVGDLVFTATAEEQDQEYFTQNNSIEKRVRVIDDAIRVLICVDTPSWEFRYLNGYLNSDERIESTVFIRRGDLRRARADEQYIDRFPTYEELRSKYDCIVMNNIGADYFSNKQLEEINQYVSEEGGSLIMISATKGTPGSFVNTPVGDMLPVVIDRVDEDPSLDVQNRFSKPFPMQLTRDGQLHIVSRLSPTTEDNKRLWRELPGQYWYYTGIKRLKPTATALVEHGTARNNYGPIPLIATQQYGRGQVLFLGINSIWRWRFMLGNKVTNRFWGQTIQYMGLPHLLGSMKRIHFQTEGREFTVGEPVELRVKALTPDFQPIRDESIVLTATERESGDEAEFTINALDEQPGFFNGEIVLKEGTWDIQAIGFEEEDTLVLDISSPQYEFTDPAMQENELRSIADRSGGSFINFDNIAELPELVSAKAKQVREQKESELWDTWLALLLIAALTAIEWILRKRVDMP